MKKDVSDERTFYNPQYFDKTFDGTNYHYEPKKGDKGYLYWELRE